MKLPKGGRVPPSDGTSHWRFPVADKVMLRANGLDKLIDAVFDFRLRNNLSIGDPERDISDFYCRQYPNFCHPEARDYDPNAARVSAEPMLNRVSRWASLTAHRMPRGGYELTLKAEAESRATICAACPKQEHNWRGGCGGCSSSTMQLIQQIKSLRSTPVDGSLSACSIMGWANTAAVWLGKEALPLTEDESKALPDNCWLKGTKT